MEESGNSVQYMSNFTSSHSIMISVTSSLLLVWAVREQKNFTICNEWGVKFLEKTASFNSTAGGINTLWWYVCAICWLHRYKMSDQTLLFISCSWDRASWYISIVKSTRCTIFEFIEYHSTCFGGSFRPSSGVQACTYSIRYVLYRLVDCSSILCPLASSQLTCMTHTWCCMYRLELLMMDGKTVRNM